MLSFFAENGGTILVGLVVLGIVAAIVTKMVRDKRKGKSVACSCGCEGCPAAASCHSK